MEGRAGALINSVTAGNAFTPRVCSANRERPPVAQGLDYNVSRRHMSTNAAPYDTSRMYRSGSHTLRDEEPAATGEDAASAVAADLRPAAAAVVAYSEYLMASADLPRDQRAVLDALRRQAHRMLWSLSASALQPSHRMTTCASEIAVSPLPPR